MATIHQEAKALLDNGKYQHAYQLLDDNEANLAGDPDFDYLLGTAAVMTKNYEQAIYVFERVLVLRPNHAGARLDMAISYFHLGNYEYAKRELQIILKLYRKSAPKPILNAVTSYLSKIEDKLTKFKQSYTASLSIGIDDNVNARSDYETVMGATLAEKVKTSNKTVTLGALYSYNHSNTLSSSYNVLLDASDYTNHSELNKSKIFLKTSLKKDHGLWSASIGPSLTISKLDGEKLYTQKALDMSVSRQTSKTTLTTFSLNESRMRFDKDSNKSSDTDKTTATIRGSKSFKDYRLTLSMFAIKEKAMGERADGDNKVKGLNVSASTKFLSGVGNVKIAYQQNEYQQLNTLFMVERKDRKPTLSLGYNFPVSKDVTASINFSHIKSLSNIDLYDYQKNQISITFNTKLF
jgi:tetratricopeptide (TPR) repeat protein